MMALDATAVVLLTNAPCLSIACGWFWMALADFDLSTCLVRSRMVRLGTNKCDDTAIMSKSPGTNNRCQSASKTQAAG